MNVDRCLTKKVIDLGALALRLSRVERITFHPNGRRPETDSDHSVMLGLIAPAFAARFFPKLNPNRVAALALVHDLPEAYAGDTPTLKITPAQLAAKRMKEGLATDRIVEEFGDAFPWLTQTLVDYEAQVEPEARFVKALDKLLPKVTHVLNNGATFDTVHGDMTRDDLVRRYARQIAELEAYASDFPELFELRAHLVGMVLDRIPEGVGA